MIILNYEEHYNKLNEFGFEKFPNRRDMSTLAYKWKSLGVSNQAIRDMLIDFCRKWDSQFCEAKYENSILETLKQLEKEQKQLPENITFTNNEILKLKEISEYEVQKIAFIIMSFIKFRGGDCIYLTANSATKQKDVFEYANVNISTKKQNLILHKLYKSGIINVELKPLLKITCNIIDFDKDKKYDIESITNFEPNKDLILQYEYIMGKAIKCNSCGKLVHKTNNKLKYCPDCAKKINIEKTKNRKSLK